MPAGGHNEFLRLFTDAKRRLKDREKCYTLSPHAECTFHPNTTLTQDYRLPEETLQRPVLERMTQECPRRMSDCVPGSPETWSHKPVTGRPPKIERNTASLPIGDYLYSQSRVRDEKKEVKRRQAEEKKIGGGTQLIKEESRRLVENMKMASYQKLFDMLDSDQDGIITAKDVDISCMCVSHINPVVVPQDALTLITPVLCDMETEGLCMRFGDFSQAADRLYAAMTVQEKKVLLNVCRSTHRKDVATSPQFNFKVVRTVPHAVAGDLV